MKKWLSIVAVVVLCLALVVGYACGAGEDEEEEGVTELKFGLGLALSGIGGALTVPVARAVEMAVENIGVFEVAGKEYRWKVIMEDNYQLSKPIEGGASSAMKLIYDDGVKFMHQSVEAAALAALPYCEENGVILTSGAGLSPATVTSDTPNLFAIAMVFDFYYGSFIDWLSTEHPEVKRVVAVYPADALGLAIHDCLSRACEYYGLEYKGLEYPPETVEYMPLVTNAMAEDPDLFCGIYGQYQLLWEMGYEGLICDYWWAETTAWGEMQWDKAAGSVLVSGPQPYGLAFPEILPVREEFESRYAVAFDQGAMAMFQVMEVFTEALKKAGTVDDTDRIIEIMETETFDIFPLGRVWFGGEMLNGIGHLLVHQMPIYLVTGERQYELEALYTSEEVEALSNEIYR